MAMLRRTRGSGTDWLPRRDQPEYGQARPGAVDHHAPRGELLAIGAGRTYQDW